MPTLRPRPIFTTIAVVAVVALGVGVGVLRYVISRQVDGVVEMAQIAHPDASDRVVALQAFVADESPPLNDRNRAVWALGRLGDERALHTLRTYYTGEPCDHGQRLCQYELHKAIKRCGGVEDIPWSGDH